VYLSVVVMVAYIIERPRAVVLLNGLECFSTRSTQCEGVEMHPWSPLVRIE
jgi:hypothetical protein